jgi:outer membrane protein, multidrug efflux system
MKPFQYGLLVPVVFFVGCTVGPDYVKPSPSVPEKWHEAPSSKPAAASQYSEWWKSFNDPLLNDLISRAIASNLDYQSALARIRDARSQRTVALAAGLPALSVHSTASRRLNSFGASGGAGNTGTTPVGGGASFGVGNQIINIFQSGLDAQWEIDLFGGIRRSVEAADANIEAAVENSRAVLVSLLGEVAINYLQLRANQQLLAVTLENLRNQQDTLYLTQVRQQAGLASHLEIAQAQSQLATTQAQLPGYEEGCKLSIHVIAILLGQEPGKLAYLREKQAPIPASPNLAEADLPSELLLRRPDIRRAERQLASANAQIGVATAAQYPRFNLTALIGLQNTNITDFTPIGKSWSMASTLSMPLFNWGSIQANIDSKKAQHDEALLAYRSTVLTAFKEVEDALVSYTEQQNKRRSLQQAVTAGQLAVTLSKELYGKGLTSFLNVLTAERALFQSQRELVESDAGTSSQLVALYKALGGGWQTAGQQILSHGAE